MNLPQSPLKKFLINRLIFAKVVQSCIGTKFISRWADLAVKIAIDAVKKVTVVGEDGSGAKGRYSVLS